MGMPSDDPPTQRLPPVGPRTPRAPLVRERVVDVPGVDPLAAQLAREMGTLRWMLALVSVLALLGLGAGLYALVRADDADDRSPAPSRVAALEQRVEELARQVDRAGRASDVSRLRRTVQAKADADQVEQLQRAVTEMQERQGTADEELAPRLDTLDTRLDDLDEQVQELRTQQAP